MNSEDQRDLYKGLDDGWTRAIELVLTPAVAGGLGFLMDRWLGTVPVFTIVFVVLAVVATFIKLWYAYEAKMRALDAAAPWGRKPAQAEPDTTPTRASMHTTPTRASMHTTPTRASMHPERP